MWAPPCGRANAQLAPSGADLENVAALLDPGHVEQPVDLAALGCGQLGPGGSWLGQQVGEHCARIRHGLVEKRGEQVVRQVIVHGYIAPGLISAVVWPTRSKGRRDRPQPVQRARYQLVHRPCQHGQHPRELLRRPFAGHVGLAEADQAVAPDPACKCVRPMDEQAGCARIGGTCCRSVGVDQSQRQVSGRAPKQPVGDCRRCRG